MPHRNPEPPANFSQVRSVVINGVRLSDEAVKTFYSN